MYNPFLIAFALKLFREKNKRRDSEELDLYQARLLRHRRRKKRQEEDELFLQEMEEQENHRLAVLGIRRCH